MWDLVERDNIKIMGHYLRVQSGKILAASHMTHTECTVMLTRCVIVMTVEERKCSARAPLSRVSIECVSEEVASSRITILFTPETFRSKVLSACIFGII